MSDNKFYDQPIINTRLNNDDDTYLRKNTEISKYSNYILDKTTMEHSRKAIHTFGLLGGPIINNNYNTLIDIESKLKGMSNKHEYDMGKKTIDESSIEYLKEFQLIDFKETIV